MVEFPLKRNQILILPFLMKLCLADKFSIIKSLRNLEFLQKKKIFVKHFSSPAGIYLFKVHNENSRKMHETCSEFTIKTLEQHQ